MHKPYKEQCGYVSFISPSCFMFYTHTPIHSQILRLKNRVKLKTEINYSALE